MTAAERKYRLKHARIIVVMGVSGSGKTTAGKKLAETLELPFCDADDFHPPENRHKLSNDIPLNDEDRWPWLREIAAHFSQWIVEGGAVLACSALKKNYRELLRQAAPSTQFVYLHGSKALIGERLAARAGSDHVLTRHEQTLEGQFRDLQIPENAIIVEAHQPVAEVQKQIISALMSQGIAQSP